MRLSEAGGIFLLRTGNTHLGDSRNPPAGEKGQTYGEPRESSCCEKGTHVRATSGIPWSCCPDEAHRCGYLRKPHRGLL
eukprot:363958-Chlamydomonas_euryale.AAC.9